MGKYSMVIPKASGIMKYTLDKANNTCANLKLSLCFYCQLFCLFIGQISLFY